MGEVVPMPEDYSAERFWNELHNILGPVNAQLLSRPMEPPYELVLQLGERTLRVPGDSKRALIQQLREAVERSA